MVNKQVKFDRKTNSIPKKPIKKSPTLPPTNAKSDRYSILTEQGEKALDRLLDKILFRGKHKKKNNNTDKKVLAQSTKPKPKPSPENTVSKNVGVKPVIIKKPPPTAPNPVRRNPNSPAPNNKARKFQYTKPTSHGERKLQRRSVEIEEIKDEKVIVRRARLETVKDINEVGFFEKINLVSYFNQKESGKLDARYVREEYLKNTKILQKENSLKFFLLESARRNLEYGEFPEIKLQIDPRLKDELDACLTSKLLASYQIVIEREDEILTKMNVDPIVISMKLKLIN